METKQNISNKGMSKLCIVVRGTSLYIARINPNPEEVTAEFETATTLYSHYPTGFNRPIRIDGDVILYPKLNGLLPAYKTGAKNYGTMLKSFMIQMIGILAAINDAGMTIRTLDKRDIGVEYSDSNAAMVLGINVETYGSVYKLINYSGITEGLSDIPLVHLFQIFTRIDIEIPDDYATILAGIAKKKYLPGQTQIYDNQLVQFWMYLIEHPKVVSKEMGRKNIKVTKYLADNDYQMIAKLVDDPKKLSRYFHKK